MLQIYYLFQIKTEQNIYVTKHIKNNIKYNIYFKEKTQQIFHLFGSL